METRQGPFSAEELEQAVAESRRLGEAIARNTRAIAAEFEAALRRRSERLTAAAEEFKAAGRG